MRIAMFRRAGKAGIAVAAHERFHGLSEDEPGYPGSVDALLGGGAELAGVAAALARAPALDLADVQLLPPLGRPGKILCVGLNYRDHAAESHLDVPEAPEIFARFATTLIGHGVPIVMPAVSTQLDYEGELVAVVGRRARGVPRAQALAHVAAYAIFNDVSVRDYQFKTRQWTLGKNFDATGAFGPWLVSADALPAGAAGLRLTTRLNGETVQEASTADLVFDVATLIERLSAVMTLEPGDLIVTGTPSGVGMARTPPLWMKAGDRVEVEIEGIGCLSNPVAAG